MNYLDILVFFKQYPHQFLFTDSMFQVAIEPEEVNNTMQKKQKILDQAQGNYD